MNRHRLVLALVVLHALIALRLLAPWPLGVQVLGTATLAALCGTLIAAIDPIFGRRHQPRLLWAGLIGVGFFSSLAVLTLLREPVLLFASVIGWQWSTDLTLEQGTSLAAGGLAALASALGYFNARRPPRVREVKVPLRDLAPQLHGFTIVQVSDLHVGLTIRRRFVRTVVERVNRLEPDVIAITGDTIDGQIAELREHTALLGELRARHGVFLVTGNHEYYSGAHGWIDEFRRLGLQVLMNEHRVLLHHGAPLLLAGVPDFTAHFFDRSHRSDPKAALTGAPPDARPRVLLAHQPRSAPAAAEAGFDLQLSGHTHGGQFLPWRWFVPLQQPYVSGLHRHGDLWVYISRGTGYWGPPKRLGAPSEITRITLLAA